MRDSNVCGNCGKIFTKRQKIFISDYPKEKNFFYFYCSKKCYDYFNRKRYTNKKIIIKGFRELERYLMLKELGR